MMEKVRAQVPATFHIGLSMDPRPHHKHEIFPDEWMPFVDSLHPQCYWRTFQRPVGAVIREAFDTWEGYGQEIGRDIPIIPALQGNGIPEDIEEAVRISVEEYGAVGVSYWRFGVIGPEQFPAINHPLPGAEEPGNGEEPGYGEPIIVRPEDAAYADGVHTDRPADEVWMVSRNKFDWLVKSTDTEAARSEVWARWDPRLPKAGRYELSVYVPERHATTRRARYKLHGVVGQPGELLVEVDQSRYSDQWVTLGIFEFDPVSNPASGVVFLNDLTGESAREIAFDALRWREVLAGGGGEAFVADGFDAPVGTAAERATAQIWPGHWVDATGFGTRYRIGTPDEAFHTGADLNLNKPTWDADAHMPVYAVASGEVTFVGKLEGWGNLVVIKHDPLVTTGEVMYARYAHVEEPRVAAGDRVQRGEAIAKVGDADGLYPYHLHFDLSPTDILGRRPGHWPRLDWNALKEHYVDPRTYILEHRPPR
ncbi:MAG: peptidoglycan DD-metalloendopeptidase family protein [Anaerolineae bacterium]|nr:peptidoglycan DD-metalloendopeptidase family protein [Anaerolineae bacterium]